MNRPLVTVICLCYNHARFVDEGVSSVLNQTYSNIQLIIVDDASTDNSVELITQIVEKHPEIEFIPLRQNQGNCKAFNVGLAKARGEYIIDFAADDVMFSEKIEHQVNYFLTLDNSYGVIFTDAVYIDERGNYLRDHFKYLLEKKLIHHIPQGDVYPDVLSTYFIPSPSMMVRSLVFKALDGYDESLAYEDFDFWTRSSRYFRYGFLNEKLIKIRRTSKSLSTGWYKKGDPQLLSTYRICKKAMELNRDENDWQAWKKRVQYELRQSVFSENHGEAKLFFELLHEGKNNSWKDLLIYRIDSLRLPLSILRDWYHHIRFYST